jgi:hypothetical protein
MFHKLADGISRAVVCDGQITIYRLTDMHRKTVDAWIEAAKAQIQACVDNEQPLLTLNHFVGQNVGPTPYSNGRGKEISEAMPDITGFTAFVMEESPQSIQLQIYMRKDMAKTRQRAVFFTFDEGLAWLKSQLQDPCDDNPTAE